MYVNGMGLRAIGRVKGIHHTTILNWIKQAGELLPNAYDPETIPQVGELDELETNIGDVPRAKLWKSQRLLLDEAPPPALREVEELHANLGLSLTHKSHKTAQLLGDLPEHLLVKSLRSFLRVSLIIPLAAIF